MRWRPEAESRMMNAELRVNYEWLMTGGWREGESGGRSQYSGARRKEEDG